MQIRRNNKNLDQIGYSEAPYTLNYNLKVRSRDALKAVEIIEQILPYFRPNLNVAIKSTVYDDQKYSMLVNLDAVEQEDTFEDVDSARFVTYTLSFSVSVSFHGYTSGTDIEIANMLKVDGSPVDIIDDDINGPVLPDDTVDPDDPDDIITTPTGQIRKIILDTLDYCLYSDNADDIKHWPVLDRYIIEPKPLSATSQEELTGITESIDDDVTEDEQYPTTARP